MTTRSVFAVYVTLPLAATLFAEIAQAQPGPQNGRNSRRRGHDERHNEDREVFQFLLTNHDAFDRAPANLNQHDTDHDPPVLTASKLSTTEA